MSAAGQLVSMCFSAAIPPAIEQCRRLLSPDRRLKVPFAAAWAITAAIAAAVGAVVCIVWPSSWPNPAGFAASAAIGAAIWWHRRKKRRAATALIGEKSRALRDALVRKARQAARPRPVLRPSPRGA